MWGAIVPFDRLTTVCVRFFCFGVMVLWCFFASSIVPECRCNKLLHGRLVGKLDVNDSIVK